LARELGVPERVISKAPSAGLWEGQTDEAEIGVTYDQLDGALAAIPGEERKEPIDAATMDRISALVAASEHKRRAIPVFRRDAVDVSSRR
jgi:NAD+ synthase